MNHKIENMNDERCGAERINGKLKKTKDGAGAENMNDERCKTTLTHPSPRFQFKVSTLIYY